MRTLAEMKEGEKGKIARIGECRGGRGHGRGRGRRRDLQTLGVREGKIVEVQSRQPMGGPIVIRIENMVITLGRRMAENVIVEIQE